MMTKKFSIIFLILIFFSFKISAATQSDWIIGAQQFAYSESKDDSVSEGITKMFPARILEKLSSGLYRTIPQDEKIQREIYRIEQEKRSLFLQLSAEIKKRDSLVTANYKERELKKKLSEEDAKIQKIKDDLANDIKKQQELINSNTTEAPQDKEALEKIKFYQTDISALFVPTNESAAAGIKSSFFEDEVTAAKINCLLTGTITAYDQYMSLTVKALVYPGAKEIAVITEIGSIDDADLMATNIASRLSPDITNSMPCTIQIGVLDMEENTRVNTYIDDVLYTNIESVLTIDSGVHFIQFTAAGYKNAGTNYYFGGGHNYKIEVTLEKTEEQTIYITPKKEIDGKFLVNGRPAEKLSDGKSKIVINGSSVLAEFITEDNKSAYIYIPEKKLEEDSLYVSKVKPLDHSDFIEKRRREMYLSYSILVTSLVSTIGLSGTVQSYRNVLGDPAKQKNIENLNEKINTANKWVLASNISSGISIACGVWFVFELYRYFSAANSVLPVSTKVTTDYIPPEPVEEVTDSEAAAESEEEPISEDVTENVVEVL